MAVDVFDREAVLAVNDERLKLRPMRNNLRVDE
jgi:hypothetical protein